jgi:hypothetical protein
MKIIRIFIFSLFFIFISVYDSFSFSNEPDYSQTNEYLKKIEDFKKPEIDIKKNVLETIENKLCHVAPELKELVYALSCGDFQTADILKDKTDIHAADNEGQNILLFYATTPETDDYPAQVHWILRNGINIDFLVYTHDT